MRTLFKYSLLLVLMIHLSLNAQDVHFSQYYASPQTLNPAFTGVFNGKIRSNLNYRNQWGGFSANGSAFSTMAASMDLHISNIAMKRNFIGAGLSVFQDKSGEGGLKTQNIMFSNSLGLNFSKRKVDNILVFGYQFGVLIRTLDYANLTFGNQYINNSLDVTAPSGERRFDEFRFGYDVSAGALWISKPSDIITYYLGGSMFHINKPNQSFFKTGEDRMGQRISIHGGLQYTFGRMFDIIPVFMWQKQGLTNEMLIGINFMFSDQGVKKDPSKPSFYVGGMTRIGDAFIFNTGVQVKTTKIGLSYDVNLSPLTQGSRFKGGPEISIEFIGNFGKRKSNFTIAAPRI